MLENSQDRPLRFKARWIFPVTSPPLGNGILEVQRGQITAIHDRDDPNAIDLGNVALIPGLVNAHTHLEFSDLLQPVLPAQPFTAWIRSLVAVRRGRVPDAATIQCGLQECFKTGTSCVGDIATQDWPVDSYRHSSLNTVVFREILGLRKERTAEQFEVARNWLHAANGSDPKITRGLSPHAPYSVHPELYQQLIDLAARHGAPVAVHLAETRSELEFLAHGTGEFVGLLQQFGAWDEAAIPRGSRPLDYLRPLAKLQRSLVIHGNYLSEEELQFLRETPAISVIYCPRTHAFFAHSAHPWLKMLEMGIPVAIGTDSRGSNPDLGVWEELRFLSQGFPQVSPSQLLELGTLAGAKALGVDSHFGSLEPGKQAALAVVDLNEGQSSDPYQLLFSARAIHASPICPDSRG